MKVILRKNLFSFMFLLNFTFDKIVLSQVKTIPKNPSRLSKMICKASFPVHDKMKFQVFCVVPFIISQCITDQRNSEPF